MLKTKVYASASGVVSVGSIFELATRLPAMTGAALCRSCTASFLFLQNQRHLGTLKWSSFCTLDPKHLFGVLQPPYKE